MLLGGLGSICSAGGALHDDDSLCLMQQVSRIDVDREVCQLSGNGKSEAPWTLRDVHHNSNPASTTFQANIHGLPESDGSEINWSVRQWADGGISSFESLYMLFSS